VLKTLYYHPVLEAKLVTPSGFAFSLLTEFTPHLRWVQVLKTQANIRPNKIGRGSSNSSFVHWSDCMAVSMRLPRPQYPVLKSCIDRLSRAKLRHALTLIDEILEAGVHLHSVDVGPLTDTDDIGLIIRSWQASEERKKIVERLQRGKLGKAKSGKWPGDTKPNYGYAKRGPGKEACLRSMIWYGSSCATGWNPIACVSAWPRSMRCRRPKNVMMSSCGWMFS